MRGKVARAIRRAFYHGRADRSSTGYVAHGSGKLQQTVEAVGARANVRELKRRYRNGDQAARAAVSALVAEEQRRKALREAFSSDW
jgi:hypothetical protein